MHELYIVKPLEGGSFEGLGIKGSFKRFKEWEYYSGLTLEDLKGKKVFLVLSSPNFFYEIHSLPLPPGGKAILKPEIIKLRLKERANQTAYLTGMVEIYYRTLKKEEGFLEVAYLALDVKDLKSYKESLKLEAKAKVEGIVFLPFALAKALLDVKEAHFLVYAEKGGLWLLVVEGGFPLFIQYQPVDELLGINFSDVLSRLTFLQNLFLREYKKKVQKVILFQKELFEGLKEREFEVELKEVEFPEFIYAPKVEGEFNFLPHEEKAIKDVLEINAKLGLLNGLLAGFLFLGGAYLYKVNLDFEKEVKRKEANLSESVQRLLSEFPQEKIQAFMSYVQERDRYLKQPEPAKILVNLAETFDGAKITSLEINKVEGQNVGPSGTQNRPQAGAQPTTGGASYQFTLTGELTGTSGSGGEKFKEIVLKLGKWAEIRENKLDFQQEKNIFIFKISGTLKNLP